MVKISVVVPVYNVEKYLEACLDSIVNQTFKDIEIICVNDGSKDKSLEILREYEKKDHRIRVISQENGGHAVATNKGMDLAKGKYLFLMDSDDILKLDALEKTYKIAEEKNVDFVLFKAINYDDASDEFYEDENYSMNAIAEKVGDDIFNFYDLEDLSIKMAVTPWTKLYKREFIVDAGIRFPEGLIFEDNVFFWEVLLSAKRIYFLKEHLFYRRWYEASSTMAGDQRFLDSIIINSMIIDVFKNYGLLDDLFKKRLYNRKISLTCIRFMQIKEEYRELYFDEMQKNFVEWLKEDKLYDYLQTVLISRNKFLLDAVLSTNNSTELKLMIENYDLKNNNKELYDKTNRNDISVIDYHEVNDLIQQSTEVDKKFIRASEENQSLTQKEIDLTQQYNDLKKINDDLLNSTSWKITKPLRYLKRIVHKE